jgi:putative SOS response-associated peptidase YedK
LLTSCAIVTTVANELLMRVHDRMPVMLDLEAQEKWLEICICEICIWPPDKDLA